MDENDVSRQPLLENNDETPASEEMSSVQRQMMEYRKRMTQKLKEKQEQM